MEKNLKPSDGRGILWGKYIDSPRTISKDVWLNDCFPQWGTFLNKEIENHKVEIGGVSLWWTGGPSWIMKTEGGTIFMIDQYSGPSHYTSEDYCGVCRQSGSESINWLRLNPQVIDPWEFKKLDGVFCTHTHADHCDIYTVKAALETTDAKFFGPPVTAERLKKYGVSDDRLVVAKVGESMKFHDVTVHFAICYDQTAIRTGDAGTVLPYEECCVSYIFETSAGNIMFLGDTWYHDGYVQIAHEFDIDIAIFDMGFNAPGATDKMSPYDAARLGQALKAKVLIPDHYDIWTNCAGNPALLIEQFERIVKENTPNIKTVIMQCAGRFDYPKDKDIGRYWYPDGSENYNFEKSAFAKKKTTYLKGEK